ncbi:deaminase domain-containing protein [Bacillus sp. AFS017274]|uniref:deaminase domain-containing protein n=1 Tax=Bacillus sp. AFS017274 TaxID=2033488 RepID=UPI002570D6D5|nr:deaminase domain-containing protein [Bacillus sp. AFS017274]
MSLQLDTPILRHLKAAAQDGKAYMRDSDTEYKILNDIAFRLGDNTQVSGDIAE